MEKQIPIPSVNLEPSRFFRSPINSPALLPPLLSFWRKLNISNTYRGKRLAMIVVQCIKYKKELDYIQMIFDRLPPCGSSKP
jgi:hypothetical protein